MSKLRLASFALGIFAFAGICAAWAIGGLKSAAADVPRLLFVSDNNASEIAVFSLPDLVVKGMITGLSQPHGLCSDPSGNIWATNTGTQQIFEYDRTGALVETLKDPKGKPFSCAVDEVAVGSITNMSGPGETHVYSGGSPGPSYDLGAMYYVHGVAYDPGDLYIVGRAGVTEGGKTKPGPFVLGELPSGSSTIHQITVTGGTIIDPGMVQWYPDGGYLAIGDRQCGTPRTTCVYHVSISGSTATIIGKTTFETYNGQPICDMAQGQIGASGEKYFVGGDDESDPKCGRAASAVYRWAFPAGGAPTNYNNSALTHPFGTAISAK